MSKEDLTIETELEPTQCRKEDRNHSINSTREQKSNLLPVL